MTFSLFKPVFTPLITLVTSVLLALFAHASWSGTLPVWISGEDGITRAMLDTHSGKIRNPHLVQASDDTRGKYGGFIALHPKRPILYAIASTQKARAIHAFTINKKDELTLLNTLEDLPIGAAHLSINPQGTALAVAYYGSATVGIYGTDDSGKLSHTILQEKVTGKSVHRKRQKKPHPHGSVFNQAGNIVHFADLGTDYIWSYTIKDNQSAKLTNKVKAPKGFGPRHIVFDPNYNFGYLTQELVGGISVLKNDKHHGKLKYVEHIKQVKEAADEAWSNVSDVQVHPSGNFVFLLNRGFDQITVYKVDKKTGKLSFVENEPVRGSIARHCAVSPDGKWLLVAGTNSGTLASFKINDDGRLTYNMKSILSIQQPKSVLIGR